MKNDLSESSPVLTTQGNPPNPPHFPSQPHCGSQGTFWDGQVWTTGESVNTEKTTGMRYKMPEKPLL